MTITGTNYDQEGLFPYLLTPLSNLLTSPYFPPPTIFSARWTGTGSYWWKCMV